MAIAESIGGGRRAAATRACQPQAVLSFVDGDLDASAAQGRHTSDAPSSANPVSEVSPDSAKDASREVDSEAATAEWLEQCSYGDRLVLETHLRLRSRPYDQQRLAELARPKMRPRPASASSAAGQCVERQVDPAHRHEVISDCVSRLSTPRVRYSRDSRTSGETIIFNARRLEREKSKLVNVEETVSRLAKPRMPTLTMSSGERELLHYNRPKQGRPRFADEQRISELASRTPRPDSLVARGRRTPGRLAEPALQTRHAPSPQVPVAELSSSVAIDVATI